ncbi:MAG: ester cyclase [Dehalococcoidia bacterium]|nr:ester cyclase [Dehalococcoidia bacterium]
MVYSAFPDGRHVFEDAIVEGGRVVRRGPFSGTHKGELQGMPPTGRRVTVSVIHIDQVENGRIVEHWGQSLY